MKPKAVYIAFEELEEKWDVCRLQMVCPHCNKEVNRLFGSGAAKVWEMANKHPDFPVLMDCCGEPVNFRRITPLIRLVGRLNEKDL